MDWSKVDAALVVAVGTSVGVWQKFRFDRKRDLTAHRRELVAEWRAMISDYHEPSDGSIKSRMGKCPVIDDPRFVSLRGLLDPVLLHRLEADDRTPEQQMQGSFVLEIMIGDKGMDADLRALSDAVDRLVEDWGLI